MAQSSTAAKPLQSPCFHCGLPIVAGCDLQVRVEGSLQPVCCPGCQAIVLSITDRGLESFYRLRAAAPAQAALPAGPDDLSLYDQPVVQLRFVRKLAVPGQLPGEWREADLLMEGMRCAACAWLVEQTLKRLPGVREAQVVYATRRARVVWDAAALPLSSLLAAVRAVGYQAWPYESGRLETLELGERRDALWRLFVAGFGMMQVMMYAFPVYLAEAGSMSADIEQLMRWAGLILTLPVMLYSAAPFFKGAWRECRARSPGMDVPVALGLGAAFAASLWATLAAAGPVYYDSVSMFVFLLLGGRYLELLARQQAGRALQSLARFIPETAHRISGDATENVPAVLLQAGESVLVRPGETLPADGILVTTRAQLNEALLSGESRPVAKTRGDALIAGSVNAGSALTLTVTRAGADTLLSAIGRMAARALAERPRWVEAARQAASLFVVLVLVCALAAAALWAVLDPSRALWVAVSVLIVTCPCALSLATPAAMAVVTGSLAQRGVVIARGRAIEALANCTDCVFDKTGTLTQGSLQLLEAVPLRGVNLQHCLSLAAALEEGSEHPIAAALRTAAGGGKPRPARDFSSRPGAGIEAWIDARRYRLGNAAFVAELHGEPVPLAWLHAEDTLAWLGDEQGWLAVFRLGDGLRAGAPEAVAALQRMGRRVHLLSGDAVLVAQRVGAQLGIAPERVVGGATPQAKLAYVRGLQAGGARVAMIGDGINDAPVLAQADASLALRGGSDLAQLSADAVLLTDSPHSVVQAMALATRARRIMRQNLAWALAYNAVVIPLAFAGLVTPIVAGIGMSASSLLVVLNALRLRGAGE